jgi:hydrogenase-1 operon protein HyaF
MANLNALDDECRSLVNQILGEGEVSISRSGELSAKTQESVLAGVWRTLYFDGDENICFDLLEVANVPHVVEFGDAPAHGINLDVQGVGPDLANALPILVEIDEHCSRYAGNGVAHSINLSLLPVSQAELEFLDERLGRGPVDILSRAYGRCQIISTMTPNVWWVRYYNSMGTLILNSIEIVNVPEVVAAAAEDLSDSAQRLNEILAPYWSDVA